MSARDFFGASAYVRRLGVKLALDERYSMFLEPVRLSVDPANPQNDWEALYRIDRQIVFPLRGKP